MIFRGNLIGRLGCGIQKVLPASPPVTMGGCACSNERPAREQPRSGRLGPPLIRGPTRSFKRIMEGWQQCTTGPPVRSTSLRAKAPPFGRQMGYLLTPAALKTSREAGRAK
jgi:hypothetical protein